MSDVEVPDVKFQGGTEDAGSWREMRIMYLMGTELFVVYTEFEAMMWNFPLYTVITTNE